MSRPCMYTPPACPAPPCRHLWVFVSKFTSAPAHQLHKLYRKVRREVARGPSHSQSQDPPPQR